LPVNAGIADVSHLIDPVQLIHDFDSQELRRDFP
jgi:hypothetical protein